MKPDDRKQIQRRLAEEGIEVGEIDGTFGKQTVKAIRTYQSRKKMEGTGELTPDQIAELLKPTKP